MIDMPKRNESPVWREDRRCHYGTFYDEHGKRRRVRLDPDYDQSVLMLKQHRDDVDRIKRRVVTREQLTVAAGGDLPIADLVDQFCDELEGARRSAGYVREVRQNVTRYAAFAKLRTVNQANTASIERWLSGLLARGRSTETRNKAATRLNTFFAWCVDRKTLADNPAAGIKRVRGDGGVDKPRALTHDELAALLASVADKRRRLAYLLGARAGLRVREAYRLMPHHLDLTPGRGWIRLDRAITKEGRDADLPMHESIERALRGMSLGATPVCGKLPVRYTWLRDLVRAGIVAKADPDLPSGNWKESDLVGYRDDRGRVLSRRCLRHTYGTHLAAAGNSPQEVAKLMRHTDPSITLQYYTDARLLDLRGAVERLDSPVNQPERKEWTA